MVAGYGHLAEGRLADAESSFELALTMLRDEFGRGHVEQRILLIYLGHVALEQGRTSAAMERFQQALETGEGTAAAEDVDTARALLGLGRCHRVRGRPAEAIEDLERALAIHLDATRDVNELAEVQFELARCLASAGRELERARELAVAARGVWSLSGGRWSEHEQQVTDWLERQP